MSSGATDLLSSGRDAELDEARSPAKEKKWSLRRSAVFVIGASTLLWVLIVLVIRAIS